MSEEYLPRANTLPRMSPRRNNVYRSNSFYDKLQCIICNKYMSSTTSEHKCEMRKDSNSHLISRNIVITEY